MNAAQKQVAAMQAKKDPECVKVVVRCRPMSRKETEDARQRIVEMDGKTGQIMVKNPEADAREAPKPFTFDQVYDWNSPQDYVFQTTAQPIVDSVLHGYNGTVFAYGQTGTGKTHTMEGQWDPPERVLKRTSPSPPSVGDGLRQGGPYGIRQEIAERPAQGGLFAARSQLPTTPSPRTRPRLFTFKMSKALAPAKKDPECVKVVVRCRPMSRKEVEDARERIVEMNDKTGEITVRNPEADAREAPKPFTFDQVYDWNSQQAYLFETTAQPIVDSVLTGYNGTVFAYGQTGTGKTHTMEGQWDPPELRGIIPRTFLHIFQQIEDTHDQNFLVRASYLEIYNEEVRDLLSKDPKNRLELKEDVDRGVYVKDLTSYVVKGVSEMENVLLAGKKNRSVGSTLMNQDSSRSHSIFTVIIESSNEHQDGSKHIRAGKLNLVDLAGSERQSKTGATGDRLKEATKIN
eukprot:CAMPEP_0174950646 /NCGR_PEP_ID=MMETSP1355-20121228/94441_1 /TAXON_ID=464990 /ORGANISM="Hemiselmis tepida, Strain CCMP443" /LENGTH=459 /DNA_ID=CAMNT_0016198277 /DNA_START=43 /DNA_END=1420 /DNA_ORIENTATION=-